MQSRRLISFVLLALAAFVSLVSAMHYDRTAAVQYAETWCSGNAYKRNPSYENYCPDRGGDCANFVSQCLIAGFGGAFNWVDGFTYEEWTNPNNWTGPNACKKPAFWADQHGCMPYAPHLKNWLTNRLGCNSVTMTPGNRYKPNWLRAGDVAFYWNGHFVIIVGFDHNGNPLYNDHCGRNSPPAPQPGHDVYHGDLLADRPTQNLTIIQVGNANDQVLDCYRLYTGNCADSTFKIWSKRHLWRCCWKEVNGGSPPWSSNPSAYFCLNWDERNGTTWDTLICHRMNFAGCSIIVLRQTPYSNLSGGSISVRGSIDDGQSWPYYIGSDQLTQASLLWAVGQRNVRLAWCYYGPVQANRYWCIDDIELLAKPSRSRDICVTEVRSPRGIITQGTPVRPTVYVWNTGQRRETLSVTFRIGAVYEQTATIMPYPYNDTMLEFSQTWVTAPGAYTAIAYANLEGDECRANDTATLTFRVVADTWVRMFPVYGGGGMKSGACLATTDSNTIFCATGNQNFFAKYLVRENLWKNRSFAPADINRGAALTYAGGDYIYAFRGGHTKSFYRYSISQNRWSCMRDAPDKIGEGGALAWTGGDYIYALRGGNKKDFYRYSISSNSWQIMNQIPVKVQGGGTLVWAGGDYLFALAGNNSKDFYRYQISNNQWTAMTQIPQKVDHGGALTYDPVRNKIYAFCGNNTNYFYVYNISSNSWSQRRSAPSPVKSGGCLAFCDYSIFGGMGMGRNDDFWRYSPPVGGFDYEGGETKGEENYTERADVSPPVLPPQTYGGDLLTYSPVDKFTPQFSPDGNYIAYIQHDTLRGCLTPYKISVSGATPETPLTSEWDSTTYEEPRWANNGGWIALPGEGGLFKISSDGQVKQQLADGVIASCRWTDNGTWLIYYKWDSINSTGRLFKVRENGTEETCLTPEGEGYLQPRPLNDSEFICVKLKDEVYQLCKISPQCEVWLTSDYMHNINPDVSPDGQWVTYQKFDESGFWQVYKMRSDGTEETRITDDSCPCQTPVFSPDNNYIAYTKWPLDLSGLCDYSQVCYRSATGVGAEVELHPADAVRENPAWSPDCQYIVYEQEVDEGTFGPPQRPRKIRQLGIAKTGLKFSGGEEIGAIPRRFELFQNRPNPFSRTTSIRYAIPQPAFVELDIYDITGRMVNRLVQTEQKPGYYTVNWHGEDKRGKRVPAGAYYYILRSDGRLLKKRMLLIK